MTTPAAGAYDKVAPFYDNTFQRPIDLAENNALFSLLNNYLDLSRGWVLDLGCGTGLLLEYVDIPPDRYLGVDISRGMLSRAREKFPEHHFLCRDMANLDFLSSGRFDHVISLFASFSYSHQPIQTMRNIARVLAPEGSLFITAYTMRYATRPTYILREDAIGRMAWTDRAFHEVFRDTGLDTVNTLGFSAYIENIGLPEPWLTRLLKLEALTLGRISPKRCYFQIAIGRKPCGSR